jgi:hypothetical protein
MTISRVGAGTYTIPGMSIINTYKVFLSKIVNPANLDISGSIVELLNYTLNN